MRKFCSAITITGLALLLSTGCRAAPQGLLEVEVGDMKRRVAALDKRQTSYVDTIIEDRRECAAFLESLGLAAWAEEHLRQTEAYLADDSSTPDSKPAGRDPAASFEWKKHKEPHDVRLLFPANEAELAASNGAVAMPISLVIWGVMAGAWVTALSTISRLRKREKLPGVVWALVFPAAVVLLFASGLLAPPMEGRQLLPFYAAPGSILVLLLGFIGYFFAGLLKNKAWIAAAALMAGVFAVFFCCFYFVAVPAANEALQGIDGVDADGPLRVGWSGTVTVEGIKSSGETGIEWSVDDVHVRPSVLALLWGKLGDVLIDIGEISVKIDPGRLAEREPTEPEDLSSLLDEVSNWARSVSSVSAGRLLVEISRGEGEDVLRFDGHGDNLLMRLKGRERAGGIHGIFESFGEAALTWRADLDTRSLEARFNIAEAVIQTDMLSDFLGQDVDLARKGWSLKGGVKASGRALLSAEGGVDWSVLLDFSGWHMQLPGLPAPFDNLRGQAELEPDGVEIVGISGYLHGDPEAHVAVSGSIEWDGNGYLDVVSRGFPLRTDWLAWATESGEWLDSFNLSGRIDFHTALRLWPGDNGIEVTNVLTRVFPRKTHLRHTETGREAVITLSRVVGDTETAEIVIGDGSVSGGKLFGYIRSAFSTTERSAGWFAVKNADLSGLLKKEQVGGVLHAEVNIMDISLQSPRSVEGFVWVDDANASLMPVIGRLLHVHNIRPLHLHIADAYCVFKAGKGRFEIIDARFASPVARIHITGSVGFDGRLNLVAVTRIGEDVTGRVPVLGPVLDWAAAKTWRGLVKTEIRGTVEKPRIIGVPFGNVASDVLDFFSK